MASPLLGSISVPFTVIACITSSLDAWNTLANTYAKPSHGHIKQLKDQLKRCTKGSKSINEYMQAIKTRSDELALLGKPVDNEDPIDKVLEGLGDEYKSIIDAVNARETPISFSELHEKLLNKEASLQSNQFTPLPLLPTANQTVQWNCQTWRPSVPYLPSFGSSPDPSTNNQRRPKPYLGRCQACGVQGHTAKHCPMFRLISHQQSSAPRSQGYQGPRSSTPWQPHANNVVLDTNNNSTWLLDSGASHHVTFDLSNLSLHSPCHSSDDVMIGDGSGF
ncbi:Zinc finger, CCHC-type [Trema orientale]|uniref:Zinc finger, CCHC-type n=1 Tax=Trema orientale TaxID=63057 RepID=A0A2P5DMY3_TREOI|nr:Zinc finger, CCHC-type [Trema orientale]